MQKFLLLVFLLTSLSLSAQMRQGDRLISTVNTGSSLFPIPDPVAGAQLSFHPSADAFYASFAASYGYAVLDRLMLGSYVNGYYTSQEQSFSRYDLTPFVRYYVLNREKLQVYGEIGSNITNSGNSSFSAFTSATLSAGVQVPLAPDVFFTPALSYFAHAGRNSLTLGTGLQLRLGQREGEERVIGRMARGQFMLGANSVGLFRRRNYFSGNVNLGGHYLLTDRLALGLTAGGNYADFDVTSSGFPTNTSGVVLGTSARYYLNNERHVLWFAEAGAGRTWSRQKYRTQRDVTLSYTSLMLGGGAQVFIREHISLEVAPAIRYNTLTDAASLDLGFGIRFGL